VTIQATPATTAPPSAAALDLTLDPVEAERFFDEYWEQQPLVVARGEARRFHGLLSPADAERVVCETGIRVPAFRLVKEGAQLPLSTYTEDIRWRPGSFSGAALVDRVADEFARGATLVLQALQLYWPAAALYCRDLEKQLGCPVQANAYQTPVAARGFAVHHDTHDVFVLQVAGRKRWRVYQPVVELPLKDQRWSPDLGDPGEPIHDFTLEAGDTLYLPRGWPHEATTSDDESLHITVGLHPQTRLDALRAALEGCAEDDVEFRRTMTADGEGPDAVLERLAARVDPEELARRLRRRFVASRRPILHDQLAQVRALDRLTLDDPLERRATVICMLEATPDGGALLLFEGKELRFPSHAVDAVRAAVELSQPFTAAELPGRLDEAGRLVLVRRLVREGFLRFSRAAGTAGRSD
jgi:bifunctional lysine-specific demethylase and histidyl-hydroxylase NO66